MNHEVKLGFDLMDANESNTYNLIQKLPVLTKCLDDFSKFLDERVKYVKEENSTASEICGLAIEIQETFHNTFNKQGISV